MAKRAVRNQRNLLLLTAIFMALAGPTSIAQTKVTAHEAGAKTDDHGG